VASRFELSEAKEVAHQLDDHPLFSAQAMRYLVATPLGAVALYALHPTSPRGAFHIYRFHGALRRLASRDLWAKGPEAQIQSNASVRSAQVLAVARAAALERVPVVVVGDTNLPGLSPILRRAFSAYQDGFQAAGWGFGYTFPGKQPFLRLDRILAGAFFRFARFGMGCRGASDHLCVWADLGRP
jgi:endonuclease/exonuclease/phosphatase (EEP) superfamily protein YafD